MDARWLASVCLACWVSLARAAAGDSSLANRSHAVIVGSSSIRQAFGRVLARGLERRGYRVTRHGVTSAGFARPDFRDANAIIDAVPISRETGLVLVYLGVNDAQSLWLEPHERRGAKRPWVAWSDARWSVVYERRVRRFIERICARGAARVVVLLPVDVVRPRLQRRLERVRDVQARAATGSSCGVAVATRGDRGRFHAGGPRRRRDGFHLTEHGARKVWQRIRDEALGTPARVREAALPRG